MHPSPHGLRAARSRGFTLIEVMISMLVLAIMAGMAWQGMDMVVKSKDASNRHTEAALRVHSVVSQWEADLRAMVASPAVPGFEAQGNGMRLTRQTDTGLQVVMWTLRGSSLFRWASPPTTNSQTLQEAWFSSYQLLGNETGTLRTLTGITTLQLHTFSSLSNAWSSAQSTGDLANNGAEQQAAAAAAALAASQAANGSQAPKIPQTPPQNTGTQVQRVALPDGIRMVLTFDTAPAAPSGASDAAPAPSARGTIQRTLRLVHP